MSKISKAVSKMNENNSLRRSEAVTNFMGGDSYKINPLDTLKMIAASSIFGEASYYRKDINDGIFKINPTFHDKIETETFSKYNNMSTTEIFTRAIDDALHFDFKGTLDLAVSLRNSYYMRLNPQVILVRASIHPDRKSFTDMNPGLFKKYLYSVATRPDDVLSQLTYYLFINKGSKSKIPSVLKRAISSKLSGLTASDINKYKNHEIGIINAVRLTHAHSSILNELMTTGTVTVPEMSKTWEQKRSEGMSWSDILYSTKMGHMALLRNLRGVFSEVNDIEMCHDYIKILKDGVRNGKQFPFRYWSAYQAIQNADNINHRQFILDSLEECIDESVKYLPHLKGRTMCLSDNSGSAWGAIPSEYGSVTVAEIDNLSSVIAASCSDEGYVGKFGDRLIIHPISKRNGILDQTKKITHNRCSDIGGSTEGGIWKFFRDAIANKDHYDNIFIFSDQQAGTGGLYGTLEDKKEYVTQLYGTHGSMINVFKLIQDYRKRVNPKVNVFSVQTAGYDNMLIPQMSYRCALLTGWTGKEILFASEYIDQWDAIENNFENNSK